jgi:hypothetical protein
MTEITKIFIDKINEDKAYNFEGYEDDKDGVSNASFTKSRSNT